MREPDKEEIWEFYQEVVAPQIQKAQRSEAELRKKLDETVGSENTEFVLKIDHHLTKHLGKEQQFINLLLLDVIFTEYKQGRKLRPIAIQGYIVLAVYDATRYFYKEKIQKVIRVMEKDLTTKEKQQIIEYLKELGKGLLWEIKSSEAKS